MKIANVLSLSLLLIANSAAAATALPDAEKHRLASYLAYVVVGVEAEAPDGGSIYTVGANCNECNGSGELGDGTVVFPCEWSDGLYYCNKGKIAKKSDGDNMDFDVDEAMCESVCNCGNCDGKCGGGCCDNCNCATPERDELFDDLKNAPKRADEGYVRKLEEQLTQALQEAETLRAGSDTCQPTEEEGLPEDQEPETEPKREEASSDVLTIYDMPGSRWNWEGRSSKSVSDSFMRSHLLSDHGVDAEGMSRSQMQIVHDNIHNGYPALGIPQTSTQTTSNCPDGRCPLPGSSGSGSCPTCPGGSSSRSSGRGLFGRWR
jgi:hypothetical protein